MQLDGRGVFLLSQIGYEVADRFAAALAPMGLRPEHFGILVHLREADGRNQQQLADLLGIHRNAMVGLVDELEALELATRVRRPDDRRAHAVHLTDRARAVLRDAETHADELEAAMLDPLDGPERTQLITLLRKVSAHAELPPGVHPGLRRRSPRRRATG